MTTLSPPPHLVGLDRYEPGLTVEEVQRELGYAGEIVKLASNENPLGPSRMALEAIRRSLAAVHRYPDGPGRKLRHAIAERLGVEPTQVALGNGSTDLIDLSARAFLGHEDDAVASRAAFARFRQVVRARNGRLREVPMCERTHDLAAMAASVGRRTRLLYVANPNNPTGTYNRRAELDALFRSLPPEVLVVLDEAYFEFAAGEADYPDGLDYVRRGENVIVLRTFSKVYGLAALRVGYAVAAPEIIASLDTIREPFNTNGLGQIAALSALTDQEHVRRTVELTTKERARVSAALLELGLRVGPSAANFLLVDVPDGPMAFRTLLRHGVIVRPLSGYGLSDAVRVSIGLPSENDRLLRAMEAVASGPNS